MLFLEDLIKNLRIDNFMKVKIKVHTNSSQEKLKKISDSEFEIWILEKPIEGKANVAIEKFLKKELGKKIKIVSGFNSRIKFVEIED